MCDQHSNVMKRLQRANLNAVEEAAASGEAL